MQPQIRQIQAERTESEPLISRNQMIALAKAFNIRVTMSTIHRWANEVGFPLVKGINGRILLYSKDEFEGFLKAKLKKIQEMK